MQSMVSPGITGVFEKMEMTSASFAHGHRARIATIAPIHLIIGVLGLPLTSDN